MSRIRLTTLALAAIAVCSGVLTASLLVPPADVPFVWEDGAGNTSASGRGPTTDTAGSATGGGSGEAQAADDFTVSDTPGRPMSLRPGGTESRWVRLTNPGDEPIEVSALSARVGQPLDGAGVPLPSCSADAVTVAPLPAPVTVPPRGSTDTQLRVSMAANTPLACQGASYPLQYTAKGTPRLQLDHTGGTPTPSATRPTTTKPAPTGTSTPSPPGGTASPSGSAASPPAGAGPASPSQPHPAGDRAESTTATGR
jgi:hypothetical protein